MEEIKIKVGDKIITKRGLVGKVEYVCDCEECNARGFNEPFVVWEDGSADYITVNQFNNNFKNFYLIGHTVIGNKATEEELEEQITDCDIEIEGWKKRKKQLRKQLWRLREEMVEDWRERKALRELRKKDKEKQSTEEATED